MKQISLLVLLLIFISLSGMEERKRELFRSPHDINTQKPHYFVLRLMCCMKDFPESSAGYSWAATMFSALAAELNRSLAVEQFHGTPIVSIDFDCKVQERDHDPDPQKLMQLLRDRGMKEVWLPKEFTPEAAQEALKKKERRFSARS